MLNLKLELWQKKKIVQGIKTLGEAHWITHQPENQWALENAYPSKFQSYFFVTYSLFALKECAWLSELLA